MGRDQHDTDNAAGDLSDRDAKGLTPLCSSRWIPGWIKNDVGKHRSNQAAHSDHKQSLILHHVPLLIASTWPLRLLTAPNP